MDALPTEQILKIGLFAIVGLAFISNMILYIALRVNGIEVNIMKSAKPGYLENLYKQTPKLRSIFLSFVSYICTLSKLLFVLVAIAIVLWRTAQ